MMPKPCEKCGSRKIYASRVDIRCNGCGKWLGDIGGVNFAERMGKAARLLRRAERHG